MIPSLRRGSDRHRGGRGATTAAATLALGLLIAGLSAGPGTIAGQTRGSALVLASEEGRVLRARLASGAVVELDGEMEVRFAGASARVTFRRAGDGLIASARAEDVEVRIAGDVWVAGGAIGLTPQAHVTLSSLGPREAILDARGLSVELMGARVPREAITMHRTSSAPIVAASEEWARVGQSPRRLLAGQTTVRSAPGGARIAAVLANALEVALLEEHDGWGRVAIEDAGIRILGWARTEELREAPPSRGSHGGGGLGEGRIGLSHCEQDGARTMYTRGRERVWRDAEGRALLTVVHPRVSVVVRDAPGPRLAVLELPGAARVGRCERPIGWISRASLDAERVDPIDED